MTLCIAWKSTDGQIHMAADSRISFGSSVVDVAVKVASLPYRIVGVNDGSSAPPVIHAGDIGLACAGSTTAMFAFKETIAEILLHLQSMKIGAVSVQGICELVFEVYKQIQPGVIKAMNGPGGVVHILATGYCPTNLTWKAFEVT